MNRWRIRTRIFGGVFALFAMVLLNGTVSVRDLVRLDDNFDRYAAVTQEMLELVSLERDLTDLRHIVLFALARDSEQALHGSRNRLEQTRIKLVAMQEQGKISDENGIFLRVGENIRALQSHLTQLIELVEQRHLLFRDRLVPALQAMEAHLWGVMQRLLTRNETGAVTQVNGAIEQVHHMGSLSARLTGVENETLLPALENGLQILDHTVGELGTHLTPEEQGAAEQLQETMLKYVGVERELARVAQQIIQTDAAEFTSLAGGQESGYSRLLQRLDKETTEQNHWTIYFVGAMALLTCLISLLIARGLAVGISRPLQGMTDVMTRLAEGDLSVEIPGQNNRDELGDMARALRVFHQAVQGMDRQNWLKEISVEFSRMLILAETIHLFGQTVMERLTPLLGGAQGAFFLFNEEEKVLKLSGGYALTPGSDLEKSIALGEGMIGQCALDQRTIELSGISPDHITILSGLGRSAPLTLLVAPLVWKNRLHGVVEVATIGPLHARHHALLEEILPMIALHLELLQRSLKTQALLRYTQQQAEELKASQAVLRLQEEELITANQQLRERGEILESQAEELRTSEEELRVQGEELQLTNATLIEKARILKEREQALIEARKVAEQRAFERELASRYKSEFLANMSHELRTPLNSLLILAEGLSDNEAGNLTKDQVESATIIHESGSHLLRLINDILDISKVEAGRMEAVIEAVNVADLVGMVERRFKRMAQSRGVLLQVVLAPESVEVIHTDRGKVEQILTNLLGNAIKFTERGEVRLVVAPWEKTGLALGVEDTGIGIESDKLERIFNAFEQADGTTSRRFGGTGLGLSIARKLARLLGGDIDVTSQVGRGSVFTLRLPDAPPSLRKDPSVPITTPAPATNGSPTRPVADYPTDDREGIRTGESVLLVVEDDPIFAGITYTQAKTKGFQCLLAQDGRTALDLAQRFRPMGIILDVGLPDMDGWGVMNRLKQDPQTQAIPVHFVSAIDARLRAMGMGAVGFLTKPVTRDQLSTVFDRVTQAAQGEKQVLLVDSDSTSRQEVAELLRQGGVRVEEVEQGDDCLAHLRQRPFQCLILNLSMAVSEGVDLLRRLTTEFGPNLLPVVVYSPRHLTSEELLRFREFTDSIIIRGGHSSDRLREEVDLFLSQVQQVVPQQKLADGLLTGRKVLVVDDDMRNTFALSKVLRSKGMKVLMAQDGNKAISQLEANRDVDVVLMDVMMPGKDGCQAIEEIRKRACWQTLPIIALTAKSMSGDRERCLMVGADGYLTKPVDLTALFGLMEACLARTPGSASP